MTGVQSNPLSFSARLESVTDVRLFRDGVDDGGCFLSIRLEWGRRELAAAFHPVFMLLTSVFGSLYRVYRARLGPALSGVEMVLWVGQVWSKEMMTSGISWWDGGVMPML